MKKTLSILSFFLLSLTTVSAQDCDLPSTFDGNTGANMTIMLLPDLITSLNVSAPDAYLVALSADGSVVGSEEVAGISQTTITIWGDDSSTQESDGALAGEAISFQLVDGDVLSEVTMPSNVSYATNGMVIQPTQASLSIICEPEEVCTPNLPSTFDGNTGANMTIMLLPDLITSLNVSASDAYLVALSADGSVVGSEVVAGISQTALSVWGDDSSTGETDGALAGEAISFQLVDGELLFDVTMPTSVTYSTNNMVPQLAPAVLTEVLCGDDDGDVSGCTNPTAFNYDANANTDDGSCIAVANGCMDATAFNYDANANTDDGSCIAVAFGCMDATAFNYDANANTDDGSCTFTVQGCTDATAENYNLDATDDDGSCEYLPISVTLLNKWNMVGYTDDEPIAISDYLASKGFSNRFDIIKDVTGNFWTPEVQLLTIFTPGQGYLMFNNTGGQFDIEFSEVFKQNISITLANKWNMVGYTDDEPIVISDYLASKGFSNRFDIIKDVTGNFWTPEVQLLSIFTPGQGYLMFNNTGGQFDISFIR